MEDTYLHIITPINLNVSTLIDFNIVNVPASHAVNRFRIVFTPSIVLPLTFTSVRAYQKNKDIVVEWQAENESNLAKYHVEKSVDGNNFITVNTACANNCWLDTHPSEGNNYYRVFSTGLNAKTEYSKVVSVYIGKEKQSISVRPNPVSNGIINLRLVNQSLGVYEVRVLNEAGQVILSKQINHTGGNNAETVQLDKYLLHGIYRLEVTSPDGNIVNRDVIY